MKNLVFIILCMTCLNFFTYGGLFCHVESFFSPNHAHLDNDNIADMGDPLEGCEDSFLFSIINYDNDRKLYSAMVLDFDTSLDEDDEEFF